MDNDNEMRCCFKAVSRNESFARVCAAAFASGLNPTVRDITDIKTAVSEAVTNAIIHGYENDPDNLVSMYCKIIAESREMEIEISDDGVGIPDIAQAKEPLFTSKPEMERPGLGFTVMESFMDSLEIQSEVGKGTRIIMRKKFE